MENERQQEQPMQHRNRSSLIASIDKNSFDHNDDNRETNNERFQSSKLFQDDSISSLSSSFSSKFSSPTPLLLSKNLEKLQSNDDVKLMINVNEKKNADIDNNDKHRDDDGTKEKSSSLSSSMRKANQNSIKSECFSNSREKNYEILSIRNHLILSWWSWLKQFNSIGIVFAFTSVLFWSFNGLSYKLNHHIHALEILTISSSIVSITYLGFVFLCYDFDGNDNDEEDDCGGDEKSKHIDCRQTKSNEYQQNRHTKWLLLFGLPGERFSLIMRCVCGTISLGCFYCSYRYIPLADSTTIRFTSPVFIAIFAHFLVKENFGPIQFLNSFITLIGVVLIGRPSFLFGSMQPQQSRSIQSNPNESSTLLYDNPIPLWRNILIDDDRESGPNKVFSANPSDYETTPSTNNDPSIFLIESSPSMIATNELLTLIDTTHWSTSLIGIILSLISAIMISISMIFMRKLRHTPPPLVIFWFSFSNVILGTIGLFLLGEYRLPTDFQCWILILMTTFCTGFDQLFITLALKLENAGAVAVIQALCVVFSFIFSFSILHEPIYSTSIVGGSFIFLSVILLGCSKLFQDDRISSSKLFSISSRWLKTNSKKFHLNQDYYSKISPRWFGGVEILGKSKSKFHSKQNYLTDYRRQHHDLLKSMLSKGTTMKSSLKINEPFLIRVRPIFCFDHHHHHHHPLPNHRNHCDYLHPHHQQQQIEQVRYSVPSFDFNNNTANQNDPGTIRNENHPQSEDDRAINER
ncbi:Solute carrier family 35 member G1 [Sarcoptes scabiei]|uniref:Solute carrier family 35 member G1 n=1 Tax=Sarcoptes scabiei TaxID=52283 RepID=A0A834R4S5_SARSC|nr:Solute carrier family 35 member G1 [Sarcoptes scabiei]